MRKCARHVCCLNENSVTDSVMIFNLQTHSVVHTSYFIYICIIGHEKKQSDVYNFNLHIIIEVAVIDLPTCSFFETRKNNLMSTVLICISLSKLR